MIKSEVFIQIKNYLYDDDYISLMDLLNIYNLHSDDVHAHIIKYAALYGAKDVLKKLLIINNMNLTDAYHMAKDAGKDEFATYIKRISSLSENFIYN